MNDWNEHVAEHAGVLRRFLPKLKPGENGCIEWNANTDKDGYGRIKIEGRQVSAHRFSFEFATGQRLTPDVLVCHHCDNPGCVAPEHLFAGTCKDNTRDMYNKGRNAITIWNPKLNWQAVDTIRRCILTDLELSDMFDCSVSAIRDVRMGRTWKDEHRGKAVMMFAEP